ncbi:hypothetical protein KIH74_19585 [Kineosporia sp. J2-2]|uniref:2'-5' RNA ligase superfamily protein n=1 Tax=Kineosporia corallincola TaxID=2835133 RepID=A0ABS5TJ78_9ACTN|nr:hypothetical protein [Kineosporia corallincola]MBT0771152.1 hypothetical protein [Kineosporia corallincola]
MKGLHNHWTDMPEWRPGRQLWAFYLTFDGATALHERIARDQHALRHVPGVEMIPRARLHLSVQGIAFRDLVGESDIERLTEAVRSVVGTRTLPTLYAGPAMEDYDAIGLPVYPAADLVALRDLIRLAAAELIAPELIHQLPESETGFVPHVSIAYAHQPVTGEDLYAGLELTDQGMTPIEVRHLSLVPLRRADRAWSWDSEVRLPFASRDRSSESAEPMPLLP